MLRVGIIGCGGIARPHAHGWAALSGRARVVAVADTVEKNAREVAAIVGAEKILADYSELLRSDDVDAVDICLPHHLHAPAIVAAAETGKHVICEKPLCTTEEEADAIVSGVSRAGITMMCAHNQLFDPCFRRARQMIDAGDLGRVRLVRTIDCFNLTRAAEAWSWRGQRDKMGGGELIDTGFHATYMLMYMAGSAPTEVQAMMANYQHPAISPAEDSVQVMVRFANGAMGNLLSSWAWDFPDGGFQFQVVGEKGQLSGRGPRLQFKPLGGWAPATMEFQPENTFAAEIRHFVECLEKGQKPIQTAEDGAAVFRLIRAAYRAAESGQAVRL